MDHREAGTTRIPSGVVVTGTSNFKISEGRTLTVAGELNLPDSFNSSITNGGRIENEGLIHFGSSCSLSDGGGLFSIHNDGTIRCSATGSSNVSLAPDEYSGNGRLEVTSGRLFISQPITLTGTLSLASGTQVGASGGFTLDAGSTLEGEGTIAAAVEFGGTVSPGFSIGTLQVTRATSFASTGVLAMELGNGTNDQFISTQSLDLGGLTIAPSLLSGYNPTPGISWTIVTASSLTGSASLVSQSAAPAGFGFFLTQSATELTLTYSAVNSFQKAYEAATGQVLGANPNLAALAVGDVDGDGRMDLIDWAFGGTLSGSNSGRDFSIDSMVPIGGGLQNVTLSYPINPVASDFTLSVEASLDLSASFSPLTFTPTGTELRGSILYQVGTVTVPTSRVTNFFRMRAVLP